MNVLDENVPLDQRDLLRSWGIRCRAIGQDLAQLSIGDDQVLTLLHQLKQPTLFTRDEHFFNRHLCHPAYGLVWLDLAPEEAALFIRRVLRHPRFATRANRMGLVIRAHPDALHFWQWPGARLQRAAWGQRR